MDRLHVLRDLAKRRTESSLATRSLSLPRSAPPTPVRHAPNGSGAHTATASSDAASYAILNRSRHSVECRLWRLIPRQTSGIPERLTVKQAGRHQLPRGEMRNLTDRQRQTLDLIRAHLRRHGFPPSRKELAASLGLTHPSSVDGHLSALQAKGWIELKRDTKARDPTAGRHGPRRATRRPCHADRRDRGGRSHRRRGPHSGPDPIGGRRAVLADAGLLPDRSR